MCSHDVYLWCVYVRVCCICTVNYWKWQAQRGSETHQGIWSQGGCPRCMCGPWHNLTFNPRQIQVRFNVIDLWCLKSVFGLLDWSFVSYFLSACLPFVLYSTYCTELLWTSQKKFTKILFFPFDINELLPLDFTNQQQIMCSVYCMCGRAREYISWTLRISIAVFSRTHCLLV